jgi:hypothetical protein
MFVSRQVLPRPDLRPLTELEPASVVWEADAPGALTPQLRVEAGSESAMSRNSVTATIERFLASAPAAWDPFVPRA